MDAMITISARIVCDFEMFTLTICDNFINLRTQGVGVK